MPVISKGIVMNGPTPIMLVMLSAVAWRSEKRRGRAVEVSELIGDNGDKINAEKQS